MSTNKKFRIQNGADIHGGGLSIDDVIVIGADGKVVAGAIQEAVAELTAADIADLQAQVTAILGTSPETLDTLQEIVTAFQDADTNLVASVASNSSDIATINATLTSGVATPADVDALDTFVKGHGEPLDAYGDITTVSGMYHAGAVHEGSFYNNGDHVSFQRYNGGYAYVAYKRLTNLEVGATYTLSASVHTTTETGYIYMVNGAATFPESSNFPTPGTVSATLLVTGDDAGTTLEQQFTVTESTMDIVFIVNGHGDQMRFSDITVSSPSVTSPLALDTTATQVVPAVNELHTEVDALTVAVATAKSEAISTAAADATTKADQAESDAKAYADQVVAATVDAAPAALDTLNELAAALGDDANFASTVTASIATKADDAATTAALALKEDKTTVATLDTYVKGAPPVHAELYSNSASAYYVNDWGPNATNSVSGIGTFTRGGQAYVAHQRITGLTVGEEYTLSTTTQSTTGSGSIQVTDGDVITSGSHPSNTVEYIPITNGVATEYSETFTATQTSMDVVFIVNQAGSDKALRFSGLSLKTTEPPTVSLDTTATQVVPAINEVHSELDALAATQSGDTSSLTTAIATAKSEAISTASADATAKADAAEADAKAYADQVVAATVDAAPAALDTLNELAAALGDDANFASTVTASIATKASQVDHDAEVARATAAEGVNASAIAATNARTAGISTSSGSTDIQMTAEVDMDSNNIKNANDVYANRGFIDTIESNDLKVQTGTVDFEGSIINFGSSTITGGGFGTATKAEIDQHLNVSAADSGDFLKWNGTDYEFTDYIQGRIASNQIVVEGTLKVEQPGSTIDWQDGLVHFGGSQVIVDEPTSANLAANKSYVDGGDSDVTAVAAAALAVESTARTAADANLQSQITALSGSTSGDVSDLQDAIDAEEAARIAADGVLQNNIDAEAAVRASADLALAGDISDEADARIAGDNAITAALNTEIGDRQSGDSALQAQIDFITSNTDPAALDSLTEIVAAFQSADDSITGVVTSNTTRISALEGSVTGIEAWNTDNVSEGSVNKYWTEQRTKDCLSGGLCITYNSTTGEISVDETEAESSLRVAESVASDDADKLDGQEGTYYRINVYNVAGTLVN
jgi:hypothetical protein